MLSDHDKLAASVVSHMMENDYSANGWRGSNRSKRRIQQNKNDYPQGNGEWIWHCTRRLAFSLADSAFAFACNNRNNLSVALDVTITFTKAVNIGDILTAEAKEFHNGRSTGLPDNSYNQKNEQVAYLKAPAQTGRTLV